MGLPDESVDGGIRLSWGYKTIEPDWHHFGESVRSKLRCVENNMARK
jgi:hypothetical protein